MPSSAIFLKYMFEIFDVIIHAILKLVFNENLCKEYKIANVTTMI